MIAIEAIRDEPERVRRAMKDRGEDAPIDRIRELDAARRASIPELDTLRARRKDVSRDLGLTGERPRELIDEMRAVGTRTKELEAQLKGAEQELHSLLLSIPNIPGDDVPSGRDDDDNVVVRSAGKQRDFDFEPLPHWEIGERLDIIDFQRGAKLSGSRFFVLKGKGARLQRALISWMLDMRVEEQGYHEMYVPYLVSRETATGSGQLPKFHDTMYHDDEDDLWMVPTAEVPLTGLHGGEILAPGMLPISYVAHTPSFRREKAAAGRDTRGIKRVHQFEKVEMYKLVEPEDSASALENMVADAEDTCARLDIPHEVLELCTGAIGFASAKTYDINMWAPGCREWLEVSSISNCTDFQARRSNIKYRTEAGARPRFLHTLNGSGLALPRLIIAILENYQQTDGSVAIPDVLWPYTGFDSIG